MNKIRFAILQLILLLTFNNGICQGKTEDPPQLQIYKIDEATVLDTTPKQLRVSHVFINEFYVVFILSNEDPYVFRITETAIRQSGSVDFGLEYVSDNGKISNGKMVIQLKGGGIAHFVLYEGETAKLLLVSRSSRFYPDEFGLDK